MQSVCNDKGVKLPWDEVGASMEERVSGGAIIQHISKLRQRFQDFGKNVPPPPKRGGGHGNSSSRGPNIGLSTPVARKPAARMSAAQMPAPPRRTRASANVRSKIRDLDSEEEVDVDVASDSEEEIGSGDAEHAASKVQERKPKVERAEDKVIRPEDEDTASHAGQKRKRGGVPTTSYKRSSRKGGDRTLSSVSSGEDAGSRDESVKSNAERYQDSIERQFFAVGADFFKDYDQKKDSMPRACSSGESEVANRIVVLRVGKSERAKAFLQGLPSQERTARETAAEPVIHSETTSVARFDGGRENMIYGDEATSSVPGLNYHSVTLGNPSHLYHEHAQPLPEAPISHDSGSFAMHNNYDSIGLGDDTFFSSNGAPHNSLVFPDHNFQASGDWDFPSMPADLVSMNFAAPAGYSALTSQQVNLGMFGSSNLYPNSFNFRSSDANTLGQGSGWSARRAVDRGSAITPNSGYMVPRALSGNSTGSDPVLYENSLPRSQALSGGFTQQVQSSAVISSASSAETPISTSPALNSSLPDNTGAIQITDNGNSEEVIWTDFLVDFNGDEDITEHNLMTDISGQRNDGVGTEE